MCKQIRVILWMLKCERRENGLSQHCSRRTIDNCVVNGNAHSNTSLLLRIMFKVKYPSFQCNIACFSFLAFFTVLRIYYVLYMLEGTSTLMASTWLSSSMDLDLTPPITSDDGDFIKDTVVTAGVKKLQTQRWPPLSSLIEEKVESNSIVTNGTMTTNTATHSSAFQLTGKHLDFVDSLLDFAIIGYPKTSTSFHIQWFSQHKEEIQAVPGEVYVICRRRDQWPRPHNHGAFFYSTKTLLILFDSYALRDGDPAALVKSLYEEGKERKASIRGYKAPVSDIVNF